MFHTRSILSDLSPINTRAAARYLTAALGLSLTLTVLIWANAADPPDGHSGAPGEPDCSACHGNLNTGPGELVITATDTIFTGDAIWPETVSIRLNSPGKTRWGFELSITDSTGATISLELIDSERTQLSTSGHYIKNTLAGTDDGQLDSSLGWRGGFLNVLPEGSYSINVSAVAADGSSDTTGDISFTRTQTLDVIYGGVCCSTAGDADHSGSVSIGDVTFLISYIFSGGPEPDCCQEANADGDPTITIGDVTYLIAYILSSGPAPVCGFAGMRCDQDSFYSARVSGL